MAPSSMRTTSRPAAPSLMGLVPLEQHSMKYWASSLRASPCESDQIPRSQGEILPSGETAVVVAANEHLPLRPRVRIFADASGAMVEPFDVDLSDDGEAAGRGVDRCLDAAGLNIDVGDYLTA